MSRIRTTVTIDERVLRAAHVKAARTGKQVSDVTEEALRHHLGLDLLDRVWKGTTIDADEAMKLSVIEQHKARRNRT